MDYLIKTSVDLFSNLTVNEKHQIQSTNLDIIDSNCKSKSQNQENEESGDDENSLKDEQDEKIKQIL